MNASTTKSMVSNTTGTIKFDSLTLAENGIVLQYEKKKVSEISYSELEKIYIKIYKLKPIYGFLFVLFPMLFAFLCFEYIQLNIEMAVALMPVIPTILKINRIHKFKRFGLIIVLKDGSVFKKHVSKKFKCDAVELINEIKKNFLRPNTNELIQQKTYSKEVDYKDNTYYFQYKRLSSVIFYPPFSSSYQ